MTLLSVLDLSLIVEGGDAAQALANTLDLARHVESLGYSRYWLAEHHNMDGVASSATAVLIGHVAGGTQRIRVGSAGIMLPNHAPLVIAEQFGTLATLYPGRIDLGVGRAPGTDPTTMRALRAHLSGAESFPNDVLELQGYLGEQSLIPGVEATPGKGTRVPIYILGSSLFGAKLAAKLGLPYGFASHFAPAALEEAVFVYRRDFRAVGSLEAPYVIAGLNVIAAPTRAEAEEQFAFVQRARVKFLLGRNANLSDADAEAILGSPAGQAIKDMATYSAVGTESEVRDYVTRFARLSQADEVITVHPSPTLEGRLRSLELLHSAMLSPVQPS